MGSRLRGAARMRCQRRIWLTVACLGITLFFQATTGTANDLTDRIDAHLAAGEFGPASVMAAQADSDQGRDRLLSRIAVAQAHAGAHRASLLTAANISSDLARASALKQIASERYGSHGARGGGVEADFESLIDMITSTVEPTSWDLIGGPGAIDGFEGGVYVNTDGLMQRLTNDGLLSRLTTLRQQAARQSENHDVGQPSEMRMVSLTRLERAVQLAWAAGERPDEAMQLMGGLRRIEYLFIYPETGDIVVAGPAGGWTYDAEGRAVDPDTGRPVVRLDDFVVVMRGILNGEGRFGCSITPRQENLAQTREFLAQSSQRPLRAGGKHRWLEELRETLGRQDIDIYGIDRQSRTARVLVEADYRMKLVGMGLEEGTVGVTSYLAMVADAGGEPSLDVLRWWFTLNYNGVTTTDQYDSFAFQGQGVCVMSENERLTEQGERVHTGDAEPINQAFARSFTQHFEELSGKYPIYAELENIFDLAMVAGLIHSENIAAQADWHLTHFGPSGAYEPERGNTPTEVETVIAHRDVNRQRFVAQVSGGVTVDPSRLVSRDALEIATDSNLASAHKVSTVPTELPTGSWWWDRQ